MLTLVEELSLRTRRVQPLRETVGRNVAADGLSPSADRRMERKPRDAQSSDAAPQRTAPSDVLDAGKPARACASGCEVLKKQYDDYEQAKRQPVAAATCGWWSASPKNIATAACRSST